MSSDEIITDNTVAKQPNRCDDDHSTVDPAHPRVTAKKTFFDLHRNHRRNDADATESKTNFHPRIQWSAGTTNIGSGYQIGIQDSGIRDIMKPVLEREPSQRDPASASAATRHPLPPVPETWGSMDAQPTQPEEIQHLLEASPVIDRSQVVEATIKPKKKVKEESRKRFTAADTTSLDSGNTEDGIVAIKPNEEFKLVNERYIREGIIPAERLSEQDSVMSESPNSQTHFGAMRGKKSNLKASIHTRRSYERGVMTPGTSPDTKPQIGQPHGGVDNERETRNRASLRELESVPGPSGQSDLQNPQRTAREIVDVGREERAQEKSVHKEQSDEVIARCEPEDSPEACNVDTFKIDNPFSDFSLKTINRNKALFKQRPDEAAIESSPVNEGLAQPSTSHRAYEIKVYERDVGRGVSVGHPDIKSRGESLLKSAISRVQKVSGFDKTVIVRKSQKILDSIAECLVLERIVKIPMKQSEVRSDEMIGVSFLLAIMHRLIGDNSSFARIKLEYSDNDHGRGNTIFSFGDKNLQAVLIPLMENLMNPNFDNFLKNFWSIVPPGLSDQCLDERLLMARNDMWDEIVSYVRTAWPRAIDKLTHVFQHRQKNVPSVYSEADAAGAVCNVFKLQQDCDNRETVLFPPKQDVQIQLTSVRSDELVDEITRRVINIGLSQDLIRKFIFLSFSPMSSVMPKRRNFGSLYFPRSVNYWPWTFRSFAPAIVDILNTDRAKTVKKLEILEPFCLSFIGNTVKNLHFTYI